jgi:homospermidine synthase
VQLVVNPSLKASSVKELIALAKEPQQETNAIVRDETAMWAKVIKTVGVKVE